MYHICPNIEREHAIALRIAQQNIMLKIDTIHSTDISNKTIAYYAFVTASPIAS